jgi:hypothetical protein
VVGAGHWKQKKRRLLEEAASAVFFDSSAAAAVAAVVAVMVWSIQASVHLVAVNCQLLGVVVVGDLHLLDLHLFDVGCLVGLDLLYRHRHCLVDCSLFLTVRGDFGGVVVVRVRRCRSTGARGGQSKEGDVIEAR